MEFKDAVNFRQSIRFFSDKQVSDEDIKDIVKTAQRAPSWINAQPWRVHVATGDALKKIKENHLRLSALGVRANADIPYAEGNTWDAFSIENMSQWSNSLRDYLGNNVGEMGYSQIHLFDAPAIAYITLPKAASKWAIYDTGSFGQTLMLAAADKKIDSMPAYEFVKYPDSVRKILNIPADTMILMGIGLGYRDENVKINGYRTIRANEDKVLTIHK